MISYLIDELGMQKTVGVKTVRKLSTQIKIIIHKYDKYCFIANQQIIIAVNYIRFGHVTLITLNEG